MTYLYGWIIGSTVIIVDITTVTKWAHADKHNHNGHEGYIKLYINWNVATCID